MLKAYSVQCADDSTGGIVFARFNAEARRIGCWAVCDTDWESVTCRRAPWADRYAPGPVPKLAMIENGWWIECDGCCTRIDLDLEDEDGKQLDPVEPQIGHMYCTPLCEQRAVRDKFTRSVREAIAIADLTNRLLARLPDAVLVNDSDSLFKRPYAYVNWRDDQWVTEACAIPFTYPGAKHGTASIRYNKLGENPYLEAPYGDHEAFTAWLAEQMANTEGERP